MHHLIDVARYQAVVISLLGKIHIIVVGALVRQLQGTVDVVADGLFLWREREEQLVKASYVFPRLGRTVLRKILRKGHHQRLTPVQYIDFLTLPFGEAVRAPKRVAGDKSAAADKNGRHHTDAAEAALNVGQRLEFHFSNDWFE